MAITSPLGRMDYLGNGSVSTYDFTFRIFAETDLVVIQRDLDNVETELVLDIDYTVDGVGRPNGGTITLSTPFTNGWTLTMLRIRPLTQGSDYRNQSTFFPDRHEDSYDEARMVDIQQQDQIERSFKLPRTVTGVSVELPVPEQDQFLKWNADGTALTQSAFADLSAVTTIGDGLSLVGGELSSDITDMGSGLSLSSGLLSVKYFIDPTLFVSIAAANTAATSSGGVIMIDTPFTTTTINFTAPVVITGFGRLTKTSGTVNFGAGLSVIPITRQVFFGYAAGDITFTKGQIFLSFPQWWGAKGDWNGSTGTDNFTPIMCAITSVVSGCEVPIIGGNFASSGSLVSRDGTVLVGQGTAASTLTYTGTDFAVKLGNYDLGLTFAGKREGLGIRHLRINLHDTTADGAVALYGTTGANLDDLYIEGITATTVSYSVLLDRGHATGTSILNNLTKVRSAHTANGFACLTTVTSTKFDGCSAHCDSTSGSSGFYFGPLSETCQVIGGNAESCVNGIKNEGIKHTVIGTRFEGNSNSDIRLESTASQMYVAGCQNLNVIDDNSTLKDSIFSGNFDQYGTVPPRITTTQRDARQTTNGMIIYNTTTNKFQGYEAGAWVNLI